MSLKVQRQWTFCFRSCLNIQGRNRRSIRVLFQQRFTFTQCNRSRLHSFQIFNRPFHYENYLSMFFFVLLFVLHKGERDALSHSCTREENNNSMSLFASISRTRTSIFRYRCPTSHPAYYYYFLLNRGHLNLNSGST